MDCCSQLPESWLLKIAGPTQFRLIARNRGKNMRTIAYIANLFPSAVEPYVMQEIAELRRRGIAVIPCSARRSTALDNGLKSWAAGTLYSATAIRSYDSGCVAVHAENID